MRDYPQMIAVNNLIEPVPRRIRATLGGQVVLDTVAARYVWEWPYFPQYYVPLGDVNSDLLVDEAHSSKLSRGTARRFGLQVGDLSRPSALRVFSGDVIDELDGLARFEWEALDAWFEEDEQIYVHPRNPYVRVDALRSNRSVRVELEGVLLAESNSPVMVFETGLPTRYYLDRTAVRFDHLEATSTVSECPYKGTTSGYWSARIGDVVHDDLAWTYAFPTRQLLPISGMIAFYNEKVDTFLDGVLLERPETHFVKH
ncbi:uncharacterized protein SAMN05892883_3739 [Jatrophihabitans sp. GAS493]|uniref:DUF427 domain-containing protein n=1 Tax=Jatrophihabitans sp. GAS493 TaxID=1907575 RepID=UPI000BB968DE|nr:DUF427 domain-containing protein [Jatrophihabitans sp. GAS493]SOD74553.1 uncharacterized protein SAMN05892883_3739 [Jatrophihabitans sp. GAS493]